MQHSFNLGASYGTLNSFRSAINLIKISQTDDAIINRFMKGIYKQRPVFPKYTETWDPQMVLSFLAGWFPVQSLSIKQLTYKTVTLMALCTAHRVQTLSKIKIDNISVFEDRLEIIILDIIKTSSLNAAQPKLILPFFTEQTNICVASTLLSYLQETANIRGSIKDLFITFKKPFHAATSQSISRWIKQTLLESGIDVKKFKAHSTRHAASSAAHRSGISLDSIKANAGWSKESNVFFKFYNRPITNKTEFAKAICNP